MIYRIRTIVLLIALSASYYVLTEYSVLWSLTQSWQFWDTDQVMWQEMTKVGVQHFLGIAISAMPVSVVIVLLVKSRPVLAAALVSVPLALSGLVGGFTWLWSSTELTLLSAIVAKDTLVLLLTAPLVTAVLSKLAFNKWVYPTHKS